VKACYVFSTGLVVSKECNPVLNHADFSRGFFLFGVYADREKRRERVKPKYHDSPSAFDDDDSRDSGKDTPDYGQKVEDCFSEADVVFSNDEKIVAIGNEVFERLTGRVKHYAELVQRPLARKQPTERETLMGMAYAISQRSSCRKRKVGAIIVDSMGNIVSSGYNEVPREERPCTQAYNNCFRDRRRSEFIASAVREFPGLAGKERDFEKFFKSQFRILDMCRALHAEENAILNLARNAPSVSLSECTLYTTTYPCRLCANKITTVGIGKIVYVEPYPDPEAKAILKSVTDECFEGVTFKAYFRVYGEEK
jgi:deoxycytidylate deaminase